MSFDRREDIRLMVEVAKLYYSEHLTQEEIATRIGTSRPTVSRLLQRAEEAGVVEISVIDPYSDLSELEEGLEKTFGLTRAVVVPTPPNPVQVNINRELGRAAAAHLQRTIHRNSTVGVSWGTTLATIAAFVQRNRKIPATFVPIIGGGGQADLHYHANSIVIELAKAFGGKYRLLHVPAVVDDAASREQLLKERAVDEVRQMAHNADVALIGLGALTPDSTTLISGYFTEEDLANLEKENAVGDICGWFIDAQGKVVDTEVHDRVIGLPPQTLREIDVVVAVAGGPQKTAVIKGACRGGYVDVLITDEDSARRVLGREVQQADSA